MARRLELDGRLHVGRAVLLLGVQGPLLSLALLRLARELQDACGAGGVLSQKQIRNDALFQTLLQLWKPPLVLLLLLQLQQRRSIARMKL